MKKENKDIRWIQRFSNYKKAFARLEALVILSNERDLNDIEQEALIQRFEYTQELAWKTIKDFFEYQGETEIKGSRDAINLAFNRNLIQNGETLLATIKSRNAASHAYDQRIAEEVCFDIIENYYDVFLELKESLEKEKINRKL